MVRRSIIAALALFVSACGPRVDATTAETCATTFGELVKQAYGSGDSARFAVAMVELTIGDSLRSVSDALSDALRGTAPKNRRSVVEPAADTVARKAAFCKAIHRLKAGDIIERAGTLGRAIADSFDIQHGRAYLAVLRAADARAAKVRDSLAGFRVVSAALTQRDGNVGLETTLSVTVSNETKHTIANAFFNVVASSPGRADPWIDVEAGHTIRGGIRPGQTATWRFRALAPSSTGADNLIPRDAKVTVTPVKLVAPSGEVLWGGAQFTNGDRQALDSLAAKYK